MKISREKFDALALDFAESEVYGWVMGESWTGYPGTEAEEQYEIRRSAKPGGTGYHDALRVIEILGLEVED